MEQIAQARIPLERAASLQEDHPKEKPSKRDGSNLGLKEPNSEIPLKARLYVMANAARSVLGYNALNVSEQILIGFAFACVCGQVVRWMLQELQTSNYLSPHDPLPVILIPCLMLFLIWLIQERLALKGHGLRDPLTRRVLWRQIIQKFKNNSKAPLTKGSESSIASQKSKQSLDNSNEEEDVNKEEVTYRPPKRTFTSAQEASIATLAEKYFNPKLPSWQKSRYLCVDDNGRWAAIRALDARKWRVDQASTLIENNLKWREKEKVDDIFLREIPAKDVKAVRTAMGDGFFGLDRTGTPVYWCPAGAVHLAPLRTQVPLENIVGVHVQLVEYNHRVWFRELSQSQNRCVYQSTCVLDLKGFSASNTAGGFWDVMQAVTSVDKDYYYENLYRVYILHAPMFFRFFWNSVSQLLQPETREKFVFLSNTKQLHEFIDAKIIPKQFGGEYEGDDALFNPVKGYTQHSQKMDAFLADYRASASSSSRSVIIPSNNKSDLLKKSST